MATPAPAPEAARDEVVAAEADAAARVSANQAERRRQMLMLLEVETAEPPRAVDILELAAADAEVQRAGWDAGWRH